MREPALTEKLARGAGAEACRHTTASVRRTELNWRADVWGSKTIKMTTKYYGEKAVNRPKCADLATDKLFR